MLLVLPPSETQARPSAGSGDPLDLADLSFPGLTDARERVLRGMVATSTRPDALRRLGAPAGAVADVLANVDVEDAPTRPAVELFHGALYAGLDAASWDPTTARRAGRRIVILSSLFGALRAHDAVPAFRLPVCALLDGLDVGLERYWRAELGPVLDEAAGRELLVDVRSSSYTSLWKPGPDVAERWVLVRVPGSPYEAKRTRGLLVRHLCGLPQGPLEPEELVPAVAEAFTTALAPPERPGRPWVLDVRLAG
ncbi:protein of unknown function DUF328 [Beutenbergia cavernae DSM 12333]|uniref:Uncharacterized protein n=1 Tax=Beutenbergia cavernae (strain ATCC BAA-8 / DSM 12333 / CCUG 43141 / JCM 11478 / NBRC 16432 / NCIMB 13614 / HKI 0122) TaxID=471853 RepID=C5BX76_BEUC1|nr:peroxide stress protein YaaA [Beutenbergia cavernae]ACQ78751.1 protein of unknown function DUF328 [Beutenbergia cavernae DSM 12333]